MKIRTLLLFVIFHFTSQFAFGQSGSLLDIKIEGNYYEERMIEISVKPNSNSDYSVIKKLPPHYSIPKIEVLNDGNLIFVHSLEGTVEVYDMNGEIIFREEYYKLPPYRGGSLKHDIWSEGFIIVVSENDVNTLHKIDNDGNSLINMELEEGMISGIELSGDGEFFAYSIVEWMNEELYNSMIIISFNRDYYQSIPKHFKKGVFNRESDIFVGWGERNIFFVDMHNEKIIWERSFDHSQLISEALIEAKDTYILISNNPKLIEKKWNYEKIEVISKNLLGNEKELFRYHLRATDVRFKVTGRESVLILDDKEFNLNKN